ncbi:MAG: hypothetical protein GXP13_07750 [Gammaproteobacteria bacterium]|nr:hypothetical protein [Gammaproteobacteria bacterium]
MAVLSWLKSKQRFTRKSAVDEFREFAKAEEKRLRSSGTEFDTDEFQQAVKLVLHKLEPSNKDYKV